MSRPRFDAVVFDLDGTLVDSRIAVIDAVSTGIREAVEAAGLPVPPIDVQLLHDALGKPAAEYFHAILPETLGHLADRVKEAATRHEVEAFQTGRGRLFDGVLEALDRLRDAEVRIAVVSNAQAPYFRAALEHTGLADRIDHAECHEELPDDAARPFKLTLLRRALAALDTPAGRTLMVGDRAEDLEAGTSAGCTTLAIPFGFGGDDEIAIADLRLESYAALPSFIGI
jgi:phosphoglycolate phosphatase-like HAD superfamily hydrolase